MPDHDLSDHDPSTGLTLTRRILILIAVMLASTLYSTTLLIASTLLPQMQGALAATPDEIAWAMTFNILATAVVTPMTGWLVGRFGRRNLMVGSILAFSFATYFCGASDSAGRAGVLAHRAGRHRGAGRAAVQRHRAGQFSAAADGFGQLDLRHGGGHWPGDRPNVGRLAGRGIQLAVGVLHAGAGRVGVRGRVAADAIGRSTGGAGAARLDRVPDACGRDVVRSACAVARAAARLVRTQARSCWRRSAPAPPSICSLHTA